MVAGSGPELICHLAAQIDVRASVDATRRADAAGQHRRHGQRAGGGPAGGRPGAVLLHRRRPVRARRADPLPGGRAAAARVAVRHREVLRRAVHRPVQPAARHPPLGRCGWPTCTGRGRTRAGEAGVIAIFCARAPRRPGADRSTATARRPGTTSTSGDVVARVPRRRRDSGRPGTWNIGTGVEVSVLRPGRHHRPAWPAGTSGPSFAAAAPRGAAAQRAGRRPRGPASWAGGRGPRWPTACAGCTSGSRPAPDRAAC